MERSEILTAMGELKLFGMRAAYDEIIATAVKRQHEPQRRAAELAQAAYTCLRGDLITAEITEKQARSIRYQLTIAKLPLAKDIADFVFEDTPINETLVRSLAGGGFLAHQRNVVLIGGTGTGKSSNLCTEHADFRAFSEQGSCEGFAHTRIACPPVTTPEK